MAERDGMTETIYARTGDAETLIRTRAGEPALDRAKWIWIDLFSPSLPDVARACEVLGVTDPPDELFHPEAFATLRSGVDWVAVGAHGLVSKARRVDTSPLIALVGRRGLLTVRYQDLPELDEIAEGAQRDPTLAAGGPDAMLVRLLDAGLQRYVPLADEVEDAILRLEDEAVLGHPRVLSDAHALRRDATVVRAVVRPQRDAVRRLIRLETALIGPAARRRLEDVYDTAARLAESLDAARAMLTAVIDLYRGAVAERANEVMKVLTVFAAIMLPLSLMAGIYGMNFAHMPELRYRWAYPALLGSMAVVGGGLWIYFSRRGFIGGPPRARTVGRGLVHVVELPVKTITGVSRTVIRVGAVATRVGAAATRVRRPRARRRNSNDRPMDDAPTGDAAAEEGPANEG